MKVVAAKSNDAERALKRGEYTVYSHRASFPIPDLLLILQRLIHILITRGLDLKPHH